jgi:hypothetical protein
MFCRTDNIPQNVPHIQIKYGNILDYFMEYCESHKTLLWI